MLQNLMFESEDFACARILVDLIDFRDGYAFRSDEF